MIIHRLWSENVLKYANLTLNDLPAQGLIGVSGANESGKSTIGETICFALFGRTFSYAEHEIVNVIRWGEPSCAVTLDFSINDRRYSVSRFLDAQGQHGARLSDDNEVSLARGVEPVREALETLLGFGFGEFIESFYLAQREITTPHPHSTAVKNMAGIGTLEQVAADAEAEIRQEHAVISDIEHALTEAEQRLTELNVDESLLPTLERKRDDQRHLQDNAIEQVANLQARTEGYRVLSGNIHSEVEAFCKVELDTTCEGWRTRVARFGTCLDGLTQQYQDDATLSGLMNELRDFAHGAKQRLSGVDQLRESANVYRKHLAGLLGEVSGAGGQGRQTIEPLSNVQARLKAQLDTVTGRRAKAHIGLFVFLLLALVVWAVWGLVTQVPESVMAQGVSFWLGDMVRGGGRAWLLVIAGILSVAAALYGWHSLSLGSKIGQLKHDSDAVAGRITTARHQAEAIDAFDSTPLPQAVRILAGFGDEALSAEVLGFEQSASADLVDAAKLDHYRAELHSLYDRFESNVTDQCAAFETQTASIQTDMNVRQEAIGRLDEDIAQERARHQTLHELKVSIANHQDHIDRCRHRIGVRELAGDLLAHGAQHMAKTFNRDIRDLVGRTLPLLTDGRYEHLKIDENLDVQVFSSQKRDFMQLEEISTGTQRQIMLAVRLALSQEFINTTLLRRQFIFLDEPFAFFDEERTRSAIQSLPKLSNELSQIWIVAQSFPEGFSCDLHIHCEQDKVGFTLSGV